MTCLSGGHKRVAWKSNHLIARHLTASIALQRTQVQFLEPKEVGSQPPVTPTQGINCHFLLDFKGTCTYGNIPTNRYTYTIKNIFLKDS